MSGNKTSFLLGISTLLFFGFGGILLIEFVQDKPFLQVVDEGSTLSTQILAGAGVGVLAGAIALLIITRRFFKDEKDFYYGLISKLNLGYGEMVFLSLCAGIGEELFFRAGIQPLIGIWWTSVLFVLLHGYLNPKNWRISIYGVVMVGIIVGFGYLFETIGIFSAMAAHATFDMVLFLNITKKDEA